MKNILPFLGTLFFALLLLGLLLLITLVASMGLVLVGRVLMLIADLKTFEATLIALGMGFIVLGGFALILRAPPTLASAMDEDTYDDLFDDEDDEDEIVPPHSRNDPCPCGSGRKYKNCHGQ